jgi:hypothetical protein
VVFDGGFLADPVKCGHGLFSIFKWRLPPVTSDCNGRHRMILDVKKAATLDFIEVCGL